MLSHTLASAQSSCIRVAATALWIQHLSPKKQAGESFLHRILTERKYSVYCHGHYFMCAPFLHKLEGNSFKFPSLLVLSIQFMHKFWYRVNNKNPPFSPNKNDDVAFHFTSLTVTWLPCWQAVSFIDIDMVFWLFDLFDWFDSFTFDTSKTFW